MSSEDGSSHNDYLKDYWDPDKAKDTKSLLRVLGFTAILIVLGTMSLPAYFNSFLIDKHDYPYLNVAAWSISGLSFIVSVLYYLRNNKIIISDRQRAIFEPKTAQGEAVFRKMLIVFFGLTISLLAYFLSSKTAPVLVHLYWLDKHKTSKTVAVADTRYRYCKNHCNGKVYLQEYEHSDYDYDYDYDYVCNMLSRQTWKSLKRGDQLKLFASMSL